MNESDPVPQTWIQSRRRHLRAEKTVGLVRYERASEYTIEKFWNSDLVS